MAKRKSTKAPAIPAVGYLRRSTGKQEMSLRDQRKEIERYQAAAGLQVDGLVTRELLASLRAAHEASRRIGGEELLAQENAASAEHLSATQLADNRLVCQAPDSLFDCFVTSP